MSLDIRELLRGDPIRLRYTWRYSTCRVNHRESVAEHSYYVALYAGVIADWYENFHLENIDDGTLPTIDWKTLSLRAVFHDIDEAVSGDMPRNFKHRDSRLHALLEEAAGVGVEATTKKLFKDESRAREFFRYWMNAKGNGIEGRIIALADFLSVLSYVTQEYESGNRNAHEHIDCLRNYFSKFEEPSFAPFFPLLDQLGHLLEETFEHSSLAAAGTMPQMLRTDTAGQRDMSVLPTGNERDRSNPAAPHSGDSEYDAANQRTRRAAASTPDGESERQVVEGRDGDGQGPYAGPTCVPGSFGDTDFTSDDDIRRQQLLEQGKRPDRSRNTEGS